jgi:hypothetical protein
MAKDHGSEIGGRAQTPGGQPCDQQDRQHRHRNTKHPLAAATRWHHPRHFSVGLDDGILYLEACVGDVMEAPSRVWFQATSQQPPYA